MPLYLYSGSLDNTTDEPRANCPRAVAGEPKESHDEHGPQTRIMSFFVSQLGNYLLILGLCTLFLSARTKVSAEYSKFGLQRSVELKISNDRDPNRDIPERF